MGMLGIGANGENPFLKKVQNDISGLGYSAQVNKDENNVTVQPNDKSKVGKTDEVEKTNSNEMAAQANINGGGQNLIDKSQFTNENDIQELDLEQFEDDM